MSAEGMSRGVPADRKEASMVAADLYPDVSAALEAIRQYENEGHRDMSAMLANAYTALMSADNVIRMSQRLRVVRAGADLFDDPTEFRDLQQSVRDAKRPDLLRALGSAVRVLIDATVAVVQESEKIVVERENES